MELPLTLNIDEFYVIMWRTSQDSNADSPYDICLNKSYADEKCKELNEKASPYTYYTVETVKSKHTKETTE